MVSVLVAIALTPVAFYALMCMLAIAFRTLETFDRWLDRRPRRARFWSGLEYFAGGLAAGAVGAFLYTVILRVIR